jgi:beta-mannosidase
MLVYALYRGEKRLSLSVMPFAPNKHLKLTDPGLSVNVTETETGFDIALSAERLARFVWLELTGKDVIFSDNGFDVPAGRTVTVTLPSQGDWTSKHVRDALRVRSLIDSF